MSIGIRSNNNRLQNKLDDALIKVNRNISKPFTVNGKQHEMPVLCEADELFTGAWLESTLINSVIYGQYFDTEVAKSGHDIFFLHQKDDGQLPFAFMSGYACYSHIQEIVPVAQTAYEVYHLTQDADFLERAYIACLKSDAWKSAYRDSRGLDLVELFCEFDTGHDNSNRFLRMNQDMARCCPPDYSQLPQDVREKIDTNIGLQCRYGDAKILRRTGTLPWLAPDMSATRYGARIALSKMAREMGKINEADEWLEKAEKTKTSLLTYLFDPETICFYDLDCNNRFVRIVSDVLSRVLCEHVVDQKLFDEIFKRHIGNPTGFWTPYPMPSISISDPLFSMADFAGGNSWSGPTAILTGIRAPRWFEHYQRSAELTHLMKKQHEAIVRADGFRNQYDPFTGESSGTPRAYTPAIMSLIDFTARLYGVRREGGILEWNCRIPYEGDPLTYTLDLPEGSFTLNNQTQFSELFVNNIPLFRVSGACRIVTDFSGNPEYLLGTELSEQRIKIAFTKDHQDISIDLKPNERVAFPRPY